MTTRPSDSDSWYDPDGTDAAMLEQIHKAGEYRRSDPPGQVQTPDAADRLVTALRTPDPAFKAVPNTVRQSAADIVEGLAAWIVSYEAEIARLTTPPAPVPEGMETTVHDIICAHAWTKDPQRADPWVRETLGHLVRDHERALAEIARLTAINAGLCAVNLRHAEAIARLTAEQPPVPPDRERHRVTRAAVLAEREACETVVAKILSDSPPIDRILSAIRARPTP